MATRRDKGEGSIYQRKSDGLWLAAYKPEGSDKTKYLSGKTEQEVKKKLREYKKEIAKGDFSQIQKISVKDYMSNWFNDVKRFELKPKSLDALTHTMNNQVFPLVGDLQIATITAHDVQNMINALATANLAYSTIKKAYNAINSCFKLGIIKGDIVKNPCVGVRLPKNLERKNKVRFLSQDEYELVCNQCVALSSNGEPIYRLGHSVIVLLYTGMRIGELLGIKWKNINYMDKTVKVEGSVVYVMNRDPDKSDDDAKFKLLDQASLKTDASVRTIVLNQKAMDALKAIQKINGTHQHVMTNSNGNLFSPRNFDRMLRAIMVRCGLEPCGAHTLRHTFASMLFKNGVDVKTVSELLGHSDVSVTYNTYIHLIKEQKQQAVEILDKL